jgi:hypothetical protein
VNDHLLSNERLDTLLGGTILKGIVAEVAAGFSWSGVRSDTQA